MLHVKKIFCNKRQLDHVKIVLIMAAYAFMISIAA